MKQRTLKTNLILWILGIAIFIFGIIYLSSAYFVSGQARKWLHTTVDSKLDYALRALDQGLQSVEISSANFVATSSFADDNQSAEAIYAQLDRFLAINPHVKGVAVAYQPGVNPRHPEGFSPYAMRTPQGITHTDIAQSKDYRSDPWYRETIGQQQSHWTHPCIESNGVSVVTSYCTPLVDAEGNAVGVVALDLDLSIIGDSLEQLKPYPHAQLMVVDNEGLVLAHPDSSQLLKASLFDAIANPGQEADAQIVADIHEGRRGWNSYDLGQEEHFLFYASAGRVPWTVTLDIPRTDVAKDLNTMFSTMMVNMIIGIVLLLAACFVIISRMTRPLEKFSDAAHQIAQGRFDTPIPEAAYKDLDELGKAMIQMEHSLDQYISQLRSTTEAKAAIEGELSIARNIQMAMVPKIFPPYPERTEIDVYATLIPAKAVGGDLYDFFLKGDELLFCIGDVSGKGVPGSLLMAITRSLFRNIAMHTQSPAAIARTLNNVISENNEENMFVTMFIGRCNLKTGEVALCNCGHNAPVTNADIVDVATMSVAPGPSARYMTHCPTNLPIGIVPDFLYQEVRMKIAPNTKIFLYTDGVTEAENLNKELYGDDRLLDTIFQYHGPISAQTSVEGIRDSVIDFTQGADQSDDITMLCFRYLGPSDSYGEQKTDQHFSVTIDNKVEDMVRLAPFLDEVSEAFGIAPDVSFQLNLALDEAVANSVNYAYPKGVEGPVLLDVHKQDDDLVFTMTDGGVPFDPTQGGDVDTTLSVEDRPIGGLGIFLIKQMMDSVSYQRTDNKNVLTMVKSMGAKKE